jgi:hypothetical protein
MAIFYRNFDHLALVASLAELGVEGSNPLARSRLPVDLTVSALGSHVSARKTAL